MRVDRLSSIVVAVLLVACSQPAVEPPESTAVKEPEPEPEVEVQPEVEPEFEPETPDGCQVLLVIEADGAKGKLDGPTTLLARAKNLTDAPLELTLEDRCPGGEAFFSGLERENGYYDYYRTCNKGRCASRPPKVIALPPGELVDISSAQIDPDGAGPCNDPIAPGTYELAFSLGERSGNPTTCGPAPIELKRK